MAAAVIFNIAAFRTQYPAFASESTFPDVTLQAYFDTATQYITNQLSCNGLTLAQLTLALNLMTAHLAQLGVLITAGQTPGIITQSQIDKISVTLKEPPANNEWQWWLNLTAYGAQLLALLTVKSTGGFYFGGSSALGGFRDGR